VARGVPLGGVLIELAAGFSRGQTYTLVGPPRRAKKWFLLEANRRPPPLVDVSRAVTAGIRRPTVTACWQNITPRFGPPPVGAFETSGGAQASAVTQFPAIYLGWSTRLSDCVLRLLLSTRPRLCRYVSVTWR